MTLPSPPPPSPSTLCISTGDVLSCIGRGPIAALIRWRTWLLRGFPMVRVPSHVAVCIQAEHVPARYRKPGSEQMPLVVESTTLASGKAIGHDGPLDGVQARYLDDFLAGYAGRVDLLRLRGDVRLHVDQTVLNGSGKPVNGWTDAVVWLESLLRRRVGYDLWGAIGSATLLPAGDGDNELFCSELVARFLEEAEAVDRRDLPDVPHELHPLDIRLLPQFLPPIRLKPEIQP